MTMPPKLTRMPRISMSLTFSFKRAHARIDTQNGLVWNKIKAVPMGIRVKE
jgi:hypothetical protein